MGSGEHSLITATRAEQLLARIRRDIVRDVLRAGSRITEEALAERYGVSRTPVREALRLLANESLLTYVPRGGYSVARVDLAAMDDLYTVRVAIEEEVASRLAALGDAPGLRRLLDFWERGPGEGDVENVDLVFADEAFHEALATACGSAVFPELLRNINLRLHALRIRDFIDSERVRRTYAQHAAILRGLLGGDARLARALLRAHIWESHNFVCASAARAALEAAT